MPSCIKTLATTPRPSLKCASSTTPRAGFFGFAFSSRISASSKSLSSKVSIPFWVIAEVSTNCVFPPQSSGLKSRLASCCLTRNGLAPGLSILFSATTIGTLAALAWFNASSVCGITPSSAATTSTTTSVMFAPLALIAVKAS